MAWTTPLTWATGRIVTAADLNTYVRDNQLQTAGAIFSSQGDILYATGANAPARLAKSTTSTQYLANTGSSNNPQWNEVALDTGVSGTLPVANGGTNASSLADKAVLITQDSGTDTVAAVAMTSSGQILIGGSSGPAVATLTAGANITITNADGAITLAVTEGAAVIPVGSIIAYSVAAAPTGYLLCDGAAVSRSTYSALFAVLSTTYGVGDGSSTFNVPDLKGRVVVGYGAGSGLTSRAIAAQGGAETHTLSESEIPSHVHAIPSSASAGSGPTLDEGAGSIGTNPTNATGGGGAHENMPPFTVVNYIIKAS